MVEQKALPELSSLYQGFPYMTIQQLTYFLATVEHGSFSAAARALYLTQPSISEQVRPARSGARNRPLRASRPRARAHRGRPPLPPRGGASSGRHRACEGRGRRGSRPAGRHARLRDVRHRLGVPDRRPRRRFPAQVPRRRLRLVGLNSSEVADQVRDASLEAGLVVLPVDDAGLDLRVARLEELVVVSREADRADAARHDRAARGSCR